MLTSTVWSVQSTFAHLHGLQNIETSQHGLQKADKVADCSISRSEVAVSCRALSLDGWRHVTFIDDGLGALTALRGVASLNLQGCTTLTDKGLEAIAHMTSLTSVNLQDCRQISGVSPREPDTS